MLFFYLVKNNLWVKQYTKIIKMCYNLAMEQDNNKINSKTEINGFYIGDIIGNSYTHENECYNHKTKDFELFTDRCKFSDDTILTSATIDWLLHTNHTRQSMVESIKKYYSNYPDRNPTIYGSLFANWVKNGCVKYCKSTGNGGAMRCSPIAWYASSTEQMDKLIYSAITPTHDTQRGRKGAKIVCYAIWYLRHGLTKEQLIAKLQEQFHIDLSINIDQYREQYKYTSDAIETVRPALISFINARDYEDAIRNAVSFGGDTDTITTICSAVSEAYYPIPRDILTRAKSYLTPDFVQLLDEFNSKVIK